MKRNKARAIKSTLTGTPALQVHVERKGAWTEKVEAMREGRRPNQARTYRSGKEYRRTTKHKEAW